jgi:glycosyltransferase XagB
MPPLEQFRKKWVSGEANETYPKSQPNYKPVRPVSKLLPVFSAHSPPTSSQFGFICGLIISLIWLIYQAPHFLVSCLYWLCWGAFMLNAFIRLGATLIPNEIVVETHTKASNDSLPVYSVIAALYDEAYMAHHLIKALLRLNYPIECLQIIIAIEADDFTTENALRLALASEAASGHIQILSVPEGTPRTKPRALNHALQICWGEYVVVYDAEDEPHPDQLREAVLRFSQSAPKLVCLQAPLRPSFKRGFIPRQFAAEYAVQFDILLPALNALSLPFPLGGTSNHFKTEILKSIGGWDAYNVTEDADLGLRLAQFGFDLALISKPTHENPPETIVQWVPQRTRWIKGYLQTLLVHTRLETPFRLKVWLGLILSLGISTLSSFCYGPFMAMVIASGLINVLQSGSYTLPFQDITLLTIGSTTAILALKEGAKRTGAPFSFGDMMSAPFYWALQSLSALYALYQLGVKPFHWDKTSHSPEITPVTKIDASFPKVYQRAL